MKKIKSIAVILILLMVFTCYPRGLESNISYAHGSTIESSENISHTHCEEGHDALSECNCEHDHDVLTKCGLSSGVKIAVFDSGISEIEVSGRTSFVEDKEILSIHGNTIARNIKDLVPDAELYDVRILNSKNEGTYSDLLKGVEWAIMNNIDIISLSSVGFETSEILNVALEKAEEHNILVVAAAGNESSDEPTYPASYPTVISVGALNEDSQIAQYSNYGAFVDVYAFPLSEGTSYSTPNIAAKAAQIIKANPNIAVKEIREQITCGKKKKIIKTNNIEDGILYAAACKHTYSYKITKSPTCTATGIKVGKCTKCKATTKISISALGHSYGAWGTFKAATCTTAGAQMRRCSRSGCYSTPTRSIPATGHSFSGAYIITKAPTCTATGTKVGKCNKCGVIISTVTIPAIGHSYGVWTTFKSATCNSEGAQKRTCTRSGCSATQTQSIPTTVHSFNGEYLTTKGPTCTATGTKVGKCNNCGVILSTVTIPAIGHSYGDWVTFKTATCNSEGAQKRTCTRSGCSATQTQSIPTTVHSFNGEYIITEGPTCTATGTKVGKCNNCGVILSTVTIPALGHSYGEWGTFKTATCNSEGARMRTCTRSGCDAKETQSIPTTVHSFNGDYTVMKEPTITEDGTKVGRCKNCNQIMSTVSIPSLGITRGVLLSTDKNEFGENSDTYKILLDICRRWFSATGNGEKDRLFALGQEARRMYREGTPLFDYQIEIEAFLNNTANVMVELDKEIRSSSLYDPLLPDAIVPDPSAEAVKLRAFYELVKTEAPFDLKNQNCWQYPYATYHGSTSNIKTQAEYMYFDGKLWSAENLGNFHYGYAGAAFGYNETILCAGAGAYQIISGTSEFDIDHMVSYWDDPNDTRYIKEGIDAYNSH